MDCVNSHRFTCDRVGRHRLCDCTDVKARWMSDITLPLSGSLVSEVNVHRHIMTQCGDIKFGDFNNVASSFSERIGCCNNHTINISCEAFYLNRSDAAHEIQFELRPVTKFTRQYAYFSLALLSLPWKLCHRYLCAATRDLKCWIFLWRDKGALAHTLVCVGNSVRMNLRTKWRIDQRQHIKRNKNI